MLLPRGAVAARGQAPSPTVDLRMAQSIAARTGTSAATAQGLPNERIASLGAAVEIARPFGLLLHIDAGGMLQSAAFEVGRGRVAAFGEAGMFTAQVRGEDQQPVGMNHPNASDNAQFVLNVLHWLAGIL